MNNLLVGLIVAFSVVLGMVIGLNVVVWSMVLKAKALGIYDELVEFLDRLSEEV